MDFITLKDKEGIQLVKDIIIHPFKVNSDDRGILVETLRKDWNDVYNEKAQFNMQYYSITKSGVARDEYMWHFHPTGQQDRFLVADGTIIVAIADQRENSKTCGILNLFLMDSLSEPYMIFIPKRVLHGFMVVSEKPAILMNFPTRLYDPKEEARIPFNEANVKLKDRTFFSWNLVRENFPHLKSFLNA